MPPQAELRGRGLVLIGIIAFALATGLTAPSFVPVARGADPAPDPQTPSPDPAPDPTPEPAPTQSSPPPSTSTAPAVQSTPTPAPVAESTAPARPKPKPKAKKRAHPSGQTAESRQGASVPKWRRSRDAATATRTASTPTAEPQLASARATSTGGSAAMILLAAFAAGLAAMLLAAVPAYALWRTWVFRPLVNRRFELGVTGVSILVGIVFAKGLIGP
jgi:outer membrane biosynthesis protein TonB